MPTRFDRLVLGVKRRFPRSYALVLPLGRALLRLKPPPDRRSHWKMRKHLRYYREVIRLARQHVPRGGSVIDVGAGETRVVAALTEFTHRVLLDIEPIRPQRGIRIIQADFLRYEPDARFDLVLCLQVLEHLDEPAPFARKLFAVGRTVIISVPYRWPEGLWPWHVQDPVDEAKLAAWTGREPTETLVVADERERLIAVYAPDRPSALGPRPS